MNNRDLGYIVDYPLEQRIEREQETAARRREADIQTERANRGLGRGPLVRKKQKLVHRETRALQALGRRNDDSPGGRVDRYLYMSLNDPNNFLHYLPYETLEQVFGEMEGVRAREKPKLMRKLRAAEKITDDVGRFRPSSTVRTYARDLPQRGTTTKSSGMRKKAPPK